MIYTQEQIKKIEHEVGRKAKNEPGTCFDSVITELFYLKLMSTTSKHGIRILKSDTLTNVFICHALNMPNLKGEEGIIASHAWIEGSFRGLKIAYDVIWGIAQPAMTYRKNGNVIYSVEYRLRDFLLNWIKHDYPGPWDERIKKECPDLHP